MSRQKWKDRNTSEDFYFDDPHDNEQTPMLNTSEYVVTPPGHKRQDTIMNEGGEDAAPPKEEEKKEEEVKSEKPKAGRRPKVDPKKDNVSCICCDLQCHDPASRDETCCCCCPLRVGVYIILCTTILLFLSRFFTMIFDFGNVYFDFWFNLINLALLSPVLVAVIFYINFLVNDTKESREKLWIGMLCVIGSLLALCLWAIIYITAVYPYAYVYLGSGPEESYYQRGSKQYSNYMDEEKGGYILAECFWFLLEGGLFLYFYFVCKKWEDTYFEREEPEPEEPKKDEENKEEKKDN